MRPAPVDSAEVRERREDLEQEQQRDQVAEQLHDQACRAGWLGADGDGRPVFCPRCKPHLERRRCGSCQQPRATCRISTAPCCAWCQHPEPVTLAVALDRVQRGHSDVHDVGVWTAELDPPHRASDPVRRVVLRRAGVEVVVWWRPATAQPWGCAVHGRTPDPACEHTAAAAGALVEHLARLIPVPWRTPAEVQP